ncbi:MAG: pyruvate carboxylase subunit B [Myxococcales bacterium]|nr:MAG: pyruvate carboxylase subunit B [Myxococcales bacterium]
MAKITETILRDAHQSLIATRMRTEDMLPIVEKLDAVGYASLECWGGATFDVCIRFLNEDPWERLREIKKRLTRTPTQMLLRGQNLVGYTHYADDVVDAFVAAAAKNGMDIFRVFDALNDTRNMERSIDAVRRAGKHAQGGICFTKSPVHTLDTFVQMGRDLKKLGCQSICVKDMAGLILPREASELVRAFKKELKLPVWVHSHNTGGYAQATYFAAIEAGADVVDCALSPLANGTAQPPTESLVAALAGTPYDTGYSLERFEPITEYFKKVREKYEPILSPISERVDVRVIKYQVPGGMISNLVSQLEQQGKLDLFEAVIAEAPKVREDMGWIPLVTPTSQIVGSQAVLNVLTGERYKMVSKEARDLALGYYGRTPAPVNPDLVARLSGEKPPITVRPADLLPPALEGVRDKYKDLVKKPEDVLTLAIYGEVAARFLRGEAKAEELPARRKEKEPEAAAPAPSPIRAYEVVVDGKGYKVEVHPAAPDSRKPLRCVEPVRRPEDRRGRPRAPLAPRRPAGL